MMTQERKAKAAFKDLAGLSPEEVAAYFASHDVQSLLEQSLKGDPVPETLGKKKLVSVRLPEDALTRLDALSRKIGIGRTTYIRMVVMRHLLEQDPSFGQ